MTKNTQLSLDRLFDSKEFDTKSFGPARWLDDDSGYITLEPAPDHKKAQEIIRYDTISGSREVLVSIDQLQIEGEEDPLIITNYEWSPDKKLLLIFTNCKRV
jgi:dipeptidyl-peptidase-4